LSSNEKVIMEIRKQKREIAEKKEGKRGRGVPFGPAVEAGTAHQDTS
jgi:hypothetical protein